MSKQQVTNIRLFGSNMCPTCQAMIAEFKQAGIDIEYIDALDEETQQICDEQNISTLPHLQILVKDRVYLDIVGYISAIDLRRYIRDAKLI